MNVSLYQVLFTKFKWNNIKDCIKFKLTKMLINTLSTTLRKKKQDEWLMNLVKL